MISNVDWSFERNIQNLQQLISCLHLVTWGENVFMLSRQKTWWCSMLFEFTIDRMYSCVRILEAHIGRVGPYWAAHVGHVHLLILRATLAI